MKTLFGILLVVLLGICGCDATSDDIGFDPDVTAYETEGDTAGDTNPDLGTTEVGFSEVDDTDHSASPVPISTTLGIDIRLTYPCVEGGGHGYFPNLHVMQGYEKEPLEQMHKEDELPVLVYKGDKEYDAQAYGNDACAPGTPRVTKVASLPVVPTSPNLFLGSVQLMQAFVGKIGSNPTFQPDIDVTLEVWCKGKLVWDSTWNPSELTGFSTPGAITVMDLFWLHTGTSECVLEPIDPINFWCVTGPC